MSREDVQLGRVDADHDDSYLYRLPYGDDVSFPIIQGYGARLSHRGAERFTLDFGMPVGTPVHAARDGVVVLVEDSHDAGCAREECGRFANFRGRAALRRHDGRVLPSRARQRASPSRRARRARAMARALRQHRASARRRICTSASIGPGAIERRSRSPCASRRARGAIATPRSGAHYLNLVD